MATSLKRAGGNGSRRVAKSAQALYLYGFSESKSGKQSSELKVSAVGVDGQSKVEAVECAGVLAWISEVDAREFAANLASKMEDLEWLSDASVRHQRAVAAIAEKMELLPARFGTVFLGTESLEADIRSRQEQLKTAFARIADADEWGVKVFMTPSNAAPGQRAASGQDYLRVKAKAIEARMRPAADQEIQELDKQLRKIARASAVTGKVSGGLKGLQWQATFLVPRSRRKQLDATLKKFAARWDKSRRIECTGPWPPYSFVGDDRESGR